jgi:hypothetical protein
MLHKRVKTGFAASILAAWTAIAWAGAGVTPDDSVPIIKPLVGSTLEEVVQRLGRPFQAFPLRETGGKLLFFETPNHDRFVIETGPGGIVVDAVVMHHER